MKNFHLGEDRTKWTLEVETSNQNCKGVDEKEGIWMDESAMCFVKVRLMDLRMSERVNKSG